MRTYAATILSLVLTSAIAMPQASPKLALGPLVPSPDGPRFEAVSIRSVDMKQDTTGYGGRYAGTHMRLHNVTPEMLLWYATGFSNSTQIEGIPAWASGPKGAQKYDVEGAAEVNLDALTDAQKNNMLLDILMSRFHLVAHVELRDEPVWKLTLAKDGLKQVGTPEKRVQAPYCWAPGRPGFMKSYDCTFADLARNLGVVDDLQVVDVTGDPSRHAFTLNFDYSANTFIVNGYRIARQPATDAPYPGLYSALPEQLGLRLIKGKVQSPVVVIDRLEPPTAN